MEIAAVVVALVLIYIAWKLLTGVIKFGLIALVIVAAIWFLTQGSVG